jgi:anthranilate phosphoribosyltransferase
MWLKVWDCRWKPRPKMCRFCWHGITSCFCLPPFIIPLSRMLLGVAKPAMLHTMADALLLTGVRRAAVVHGAGGYDELTTMGPARVVMVRDGATEEMEINPADHGFAPCTPAQLEVHDRQEALEVMRLLLAGEGPAPMLDMMAFNAGLAVYLMEDSMPISAAMARARQAVAGGAGGKVLDA